MPSEEAVRGESKGPSTVAVGVTGSVRRATPALARPPGRAPGTLRLRRGEVEFGHAHEVVGRRGELQPEAIAR